MSYFRIENRGVGSEKSQVVVELKDQNKRN